MIINKIDHIHPDKLLTLIDHIMKNFNLRKSFQFQHLMEIILTDCWRLRKYLPEGPLYYPADQVTDHPERFIITELIREKALHLTREEIPHSLAVVLEKMEKDSNKEMIHVMATIIVERDSQKGIVIGKQGKMLKEIGKSARVRYRKFTWVKSIFRSMGKSTKGLAK